MQPMELMKAAAVSAFPIADSRPIEGLPQRDGFDVTGWAGRSTGRAGAVAFYVGPSYLEVHFWNKVERIEFVARHTGGMFWVGGVREVSIDMRAEWFVSIVKAWQYVDHGSFHRAMIEQIGRTDRNLNRLTSIDTDKTRELIPLWELWTLELSIERAARNG